MRLVDLLVTEELSNYFVESHLFYSFKSENFRLKNQFFACYSNFLRYSQVYDEFLKIYLIPSKITDCCIFTRCF